MDDIIDVFSAANKFRLDPVRFLIAWNGVLVLAFEGFPDCIESAKNELTKRVPILHENPGSKWPKVTLAALSNQRHLSESDFEVLKKIFSRYEERLKNKSITFDAVSVVQFNCRSLESIRKRHDIALTPSLQDTISAEQKGFVSTILAELESPDYFSLASRSGRDVRYYREDHVESTLVAFLNGALEAEICLLREEIDKELPGLYEWIGAESRHVTLLGLRHL